MAARTKKTNTPEKETKRQIKFYSLTGEDTVSGNDGQESTLPMNLFSDVPLALGKMNRTLSETENYIIAELKYQMQIFLEQNPTWDITRPMSFTLSIKDIAEQRKIKSTGAFKRIIDDVVDKMSENIPSMVVKYKDKQGYENVLTAALIDTINFNKSSGIINVRVGLGYQTYYVTYIMNEPELQIPKSFYLQMKSKYAMPLADYLIGVIGEERKKGSLGKEYMFDIPLEALMDHVRPQTDLVVRDYLRRVVETAINDINNNPESPIQILDTDKLRVKEGRSIVAVHFHVLLTNTKEMIYRSYPDATVIDANGTPSKEYVYHWLENRLKINESYMKKVKKTPLSFVWKVLLYTYAIAENPGPKYFNRVLSNAADNLRNYTLQDLCRKFKTRYPEYDDEIIESIIAMETDII